MLTTEQQAIMQDAITRTRASVAKMPPPFKALMEPIPETMEGLYVLWQDAENRATITDDMIDRAAEAYEFGVMPGDESEATDQEIREMAERVLRAALSEG